MDNFLQRAILAAPVIIFSLSVHEYFHAWTANKFGDSTAKDMGRLTLNPLAHLDVMGTLVLFISQFRFGWAKPVPVNPYNLKNLRHDHFWISAAGPLSNLGLGLIAGTILRFLDYAFQQGIITGVDSRFFNGLFEMLFLGVMINVSLAFFNLLPIFPLDGSHIFRNVFPERYGYIFDKIERVAPMLLIVLIASGFIFGTSLIWIILGPIIKLVVFLFSGIQLY